MTSRALQRTSLPGNVLDQVDNHGRRIRILEERVGVSGPTFIPPNLVTPVYNVQTDFGAAGDGVVDDTVSIQAAIDTAVGAGGGTVYFPPGVYIVEAETANGNILTIGGTNVKLLGAGIGLSTIKVADSATPYKAIINSVTDTTDVSGLEVYGLTFDHNINANALTSTAQIAAELQYTLRVGAGTGIRIHHCRVQNTSSVNQFVMQGSATQLRQIWITDNEFVEIGDDPNHISHDASVIYAHADEVVISRNIIISAGIDSPGGVAAIETHGSSMVIADNVIKDWRYGLNVTGVDNVGDDQRQLVANNTIENALMGILIWSWIYPSQHTSGYGIDEFIISGNSITLAETGTYSSSDPPSGIVVQFDSTLPIRGLIIENNTILSPLETTVKTANSVSIGLGFFSNDAITLENCVIRDNSITNFPMAGVRFSGCHLKNMVIRGNTLVNCGSTLDSPVVAYRTPMFLSAITIEGLVIDSNYFFDDIATTRVSYFIYILTTTSADDVRMLNNYFVKTGSGGNWIKPIILAENITKPLLIGDMPVFVTPTGQVSLGSRLIDRSNGFVYTTKSDGLTWWVVDWPVTWLVAADFALSAGWGNTATKTVATNSTDRGFIITVTANGTGIAVNPTITLTFKDSAWTFPPFAVCMLNAWSAGAWTPVIHTVAADSNSITLTFLGTPGAGTSYQISCVLVP